MSGEPFMPLFLGDVLAETLGWTGEERALYVYLLAVQWFSGPLATDPKRLACTAQYNEETFLRLWDKVRVKFAPSEDGAGLINLKCEQHRARVQRLSSARAAVGAIGGKTTQARRRATATQLAPAQQPCACDTDQGAQLNAATIGASRVYQSDQQQPAAQATGEANAQANGEANKRANGTATDKHPIQSNPIQPKPIKRERAPPRAKARVGPPSPAVAGLDAAAWERFCEYRREIRKTIKPASILAAQRKLAGFGADQAEVVEQTIANSWQGLFPLQPTASAKTSPHKAAADEAWQRVVRHVRNGGYRSRSLGDKRIDEAIRQIGGYSAIGQSPERELPFFERRFVASYVALVSS